MEVVSAGKSALRRLMMARLKAQPADDVNTASAAVCHHLAQFLVSAIFPLYSRVAVCAYLPLGYEVDLKNLMRTCWDVRKRAADETDRKARDLTVSVFTPLMIPQNKGDMVFVQVKGEQDLADNFPPGAKYGICELREEEAAAAISTHLLAGHQPSQDSVLLDRSWPMGIKEERQQRLLILPSLAAASGWRRGDVVMQLCPGVAFDRFGRRLGKGGHYYDAAIDATRQACAVTGAHVCAIGVAFDWQVLNEARVDQTDSGEEGLGIIPMGPDDSYLDYIASPSLGIAACAKPA